MTALNNAQAGTKWAVNLLQVERLNKLVVTAMAVLAMTAADSANAYEYSQTTLNDVLRLDMAVQQDLDPLDAGLAGDTIDYYNGTVSFAATDVNVPGNFPIPVQVRRELVPGKDSFEQFGDWELDIPRIQGRFYQESDFDCQVPIPPVVKSQAGTANFGAAMYHNGVTLSDGNGYSGRLFYSDMEAAPYPMPAGYTYHTKENWIVQCDGSAYVAQSPDGLTYHFDQRHNHGGATVELSDPDSISVKNVAVRVSRIEDRFGNYVTYSYDGSKRLSAITSSDGREILFTYVSGTDRIQNISTNDRVWTYDYEGPYHANQMVLSTVTLPNAKQWKYHLFACSTGACQGTSPYSSYRHFGGGKGQTSDSPNLFTYQGIQVTHPEGAVVSYEFKTSIMHRFGLKLPIDLTSSTEPIKCTFPQCWGAVLSMALTKKTITYAPNRSYTWTYQYSENQCCPDIYDSSHEPINAAATRQTTTVVGPDNILELQFWRYADWNEGNELTRTIKDLDGTELSRTDQEWIQSPDYGYSIILYKGVNKAREEYQPRLGQRKITQAADVYTSDYMDFNTYGVSRLTHEYNSFSSAERYTKRGYLQDQINWLINQPTTTRFSDDGITYTVVGETTYHSATGVYKSKPYEEKKFGTWTRRYASYHLSGDAQGAPERIEFNVKLRDASGAETTGFRYQQLDSYKRGKPQTVTYPARYSDTAVIQALQTVDNNGWVTSVTDLNGNTTGYAYDPMGWLVSVDLPDQWLDTLFEWSTDASGNPVRAAKRCALTLDKRSCADLPVYTEIKHYDYWLRPTLTSRKDEVAGVTRYKNQTYDSENRTTFESYWSFNAAEPDGTTYTYDTLGRIRATSYTGGGTDTVEYISGNRKRVTNGRGYVTTTTYRAYGQPEYETMTLAESPEGVSTAQSVNVFGDITSVTQSGPGKDGVGTVSQTEYRAYDSQHQLCKVRRQDVGQTAFQYNRLGEMVWAAEGVGGGSATDCVSDATATEKVTIQYDNLGGASDILYPDDSPDVSYLRDDKGNVLWLTSGDEYQEYQYNSLDRVTHETLSVDTKSFTVQHIYNDSGNTESLIYPDGTQVDYTPDQFGNPTKVDNPLQRYAFDIQYHANGSIDSFVYGNGLQHKTTLNARRLPATVDEWSYGATAQRYSYQYDNAGNLTRLTDRLDNSYTLTNLTYDGLDRLESTSGNSGIGSSAITYDGLGNITSYTNKKYQLDYSYDTAKNRLASVSGGKAYSFQYDARGNVTHNGTRGFTFNRANQMQASGSNSYVYDGFNRRVKTQDSTGTTYSFYSQSGKLLFREANGDGVNYVYLGGRLIAKEGVLSPVNDTRQHYLPFGDTLETAQNDVGYTGHKYDTDLGLSYMQARYYDPVIGRFYSNDPVGFRDIHSFNRYAYANNNQYRYIDPNGMEVVSVYARTNDMLFMVDQNSRAWALVQAISGGKPFGDPIPAGNYAILERAGRDDYYRLESLDSRFGDDETPNGRSLLRLHGPGRTIGCISVCSLNGFEKIEKLLQSTAKSTAKVDDKSIIGRILGRQESLVNFGSIRVLSAGYSLSFDAKSGEISISGKRTGSHIHRKEVICTVTEDGGCK